MIRKKLIVAYFKDLLNYLMETNLLLHLYLVA